MIMRFKLIIDGKLFRVIEAESFTEAHDIVRTICWPVRMPVGSYRLEVIK